MPVFGKGDRRRPSRTAAIVLRNVQWTFDDEDIDASIPSVARTSRAVRASTSAPASVSAIVVAMLSIRPPPQSALAACRPVRSLRPIWRVCATPPNSSISMRVSDLPEYRRASVFQRATVVTSTWTRPVEPRTNSHPHYLFPSRSIVARPAACIEMELRTSMAVEVHEHRRFPCS
jgi:hypothetical protein